MLKLNNPITKNLSGDIFEVTEAAFDFKNHGMKVAWQVTGDKGVVKTGVLVIADDEQEGIFEFTEWYNNVYLTHNSLVETIAEKVGFSGTPINGTYV